MQINTEKIVAAFEENPVAFLAVTSGLLMAMSKIIGAIGDSRGSHAYARDVNRRIRRDARKSK